MPGPGRDAQPDEVAAHDQRAIVSRLTRSSSNFLSSQRASRSRPADEPFAAGRPGRPRRGRP